MYIYISFFSYIYILYIIYIHVSAHLHARNCTCESMCTPILAYLYNSAYYIYIYIHIHVTVYMSHIIYIIIQYCIYMAVCQNLVPLLFTSKSLGFMDVHPTIVMYL